MQPLPCPFCGAPARVYGYPWAYVGCEGENCILRNLTTGRPDTTVPNAIAAWNQRWPVKRRGSRAS